MPFPGYSGWVMQLDPVAASGGSRTMLDINNPATGIMIGSTSGGTGPDFGTAEITEYLAQQGQWGSTVAGYVFPNRTITIPLVLGSQANGVSPNTALQQLREKVALFQREGGWLLRQRSGGLNMYADVVDAQLAVPDVWGETGDYEPDVTLTLIALPDFYGDEIALDIASSTGVYAAVVGTDPTNLVLDPSFEHDTVGSAPAWWLQLATGSTFQVQNGWAESGSNSLRYTMTSSTGSETAGVETPTGTSGMPVVGGASYEALVTVNVLTNTAGGNTSAARINWYTSAGALISTSPIGAGGGGNLPSSAGVYSFAGSVAAPSNAAFANLAVAVKFSASGQEIDMYVDAVALLMSGAAYLDGDSTGCVWLGVPGDSESASDAVIQGDHPARARIVVTDESGNNQLGLLWGVRSRHYDPAATAALVYEGELLTGVNGAASASLAGASGGSVMEITSLPAAAWVSFLQTNTASGNQPLTHQGTYRVWARAYSSTGTPQLQFLWGVGSLSAPVSNAPVTLPGSGAFYLVDLGVIRLDPIPVGANEWFGVVQAYSPNGGDMAAIDVLYLQPLDEAAGELAYTAVTPPSAISTAMSATSGVDNSGVGTLAWTNPEYATFSGTYASAESASTVTTHYLVGTGFGFSIPSGSTIVGIAASLGRQNSTDSGFQNLKDNSVRLVKAGAVQSVGEHAVSAPWPANGGSLPPSEFQLYGGPTDLWGSTWAPADINNSGFGVAISASMTAVGGGYYTLALIYGPMRITVYYTLASGFTVSQDAVVYANETAEIRWDKPVRQGPSSGPYGPINQVIGDLARLPPSGMEDRPCQVFVKPTRGDLDTLPDTGLDAFTVQIKYRPTWLFRP